MRALPILVLLSLSALVPMTACAQAADKPTAQPATLPAPPVGWTVLEAPDLPGIQPKIERLVNEDRTARIDELRVRGESKKVKVHTKWIPLPDYEIVVGDATREPVAGPNGQHGIIGQRVWELLEF